MSTSTPNVDNVNCKKNDSAINSVKDSSSYGGDGDNGDDDKFEDCSEGPSKSTSDDSCTGNECSPININININKDNCDKQMSTVNDASPSNTDGKSDDDENHTSNVNINNNIDGNDDSSIPIKRWKSYLDIRQSRPCLKEFFDRIDQTCIREDCRQLVDKLGNTGQEAKLSVISDLESILTTYAEKTDSNYFTNNGWIEILQPLLALKVDRDDAYAMFEAIHKRYIPNCFSFTKNTEDDETMVQTINDQPFHLLRLLLFYHDPELGSFLDTKKINPDSYALSWFRSLFAAHCDIKVLLALWDEYFQRSNPFLIFFLALVMLVNAKEQVMSLKDQSQEAIIEALNSVPSALEVEDVADLFYLVESHYVSQTPGCIKDLHHLVFNTESSSESSLDITDLAQALCLPVSVSHILPSSTNQSGVRFFIVDCRPAEQYNNGRLSTAFHLDCSLMLQEPSAFNTAVQAILAAQKQAVLAGSHAGGKHLCFLGSGRDEEDRYVHMVVASFLQKHHLFVSLAFGGYAALHSYVLRNNCLDKFFLDHNKRHCLCCRHPQHFAKNGSMAPKSLSSSSSSIAGSQHGGSDTEHFSTSILDRMTSVVRSKTSVIKDKLVDYIVNPNSANDERHVDSGDIGKRYRGSNVFSLFEVDIGDTISATDTCDELEFNVEDWCKEQEALGCYRCEELTDDGKRFPSYLVITSTHLNIVRAIPHNRGYGKVVAKRPLEMIVQITSKRKVPNLITIKYGQANEDGGSGPNIMACDRLNIPEPFPVTRLVKQQVVKVLKGETDKVPEEECHDSSR